MEDFDERTYYIDSRDYSAGEQLTGYLSSLFSVLQAPPIYLCIGSDRVIGDSLGPLVGTLLLCAAPSLRVFGTLQAPIHALNLCEALDELSARFPGRPIVAIDASLGTRAHQEYFTVGFGSISPGAGVHKSLCAVGDLFITGIVAPFGPFSQLSLQSVRHPLIARLAATIAHSILSADKSLGCDQSFAVR